MVITFTYRPSLVRIDAQQHNEKNTSVSIYFFIVLFFRAPFYVLLVFVAVCFVFWLFWLSYQYLPTDWLEILL